MRRLVMLLIIAGIAGLIGFVVITEPQTIREAALPSHTPSLANGEQIFLAGGCASCHATPASDRCDDPQYKDKHALGGGRCLLTPFGTFYVPNISSDKATGIGSWTNIQFINAMKKGVSPGGRHYYPAFPYTSYQRMNFADLIDLKAYLDTLPALKTTVPEHDLALPFRFRRGLGLWKAMFLDGKSFVPDPSKSDEVNRGGYLVEGPGHCGECHTPRNFAGGFDMKKHLAGGPAPEGDGWIPNITPAKDGLGGWSAGDIDSMLSSGMLPDGDFVGGSMAAVQRNMAALRPEDRKAIVAYLKALQPIENPKPKAPLVGSN
ncbi:MAG: cytochrome c [Hyphomicrobiaceae bacterium]